MTPATNLPWTWLPDEGQFIVNEKRDIVAEVPCQGAEPQDGAYLVHAANNYPRLLSALVALEQAYSNKHSPQHRAACLAQAQAAIFAAS